MKEISSTTYSSAHSTRSRVRGSPTRDILRRHPAPGRHTTPPNPAVTLYVIVATAPRAGAAIPKPECPSPFPASKVPAFKAAKTLRDAVNEQHGECRGPDDGAQPGNTAGAPHDVRLGQERSSLAETGRRRRRAILPPDPLNPGKLRGIGHLSLREVI